MKLSTKSRYAVTAMLDLAIHDRVGPVTLADISQTQGISLSYLEQLFAKLRKQGLVAGVRGPGGGYRLAQPAHEITVASIITAVDENVKMTRCQGSGDCHDGQRCLTHQLWDELSEQLFTFLDGITLDQFANRPEVQQIVRRQQQQHPRPAHPHFIFGRSAA
ncbi:transcriptional regulator, BadM/Rrf2 family [Ectothiorhodospira magna]|uniref:Transcriptional regulator, BadM/Rrf2 family n=1 Tax=Ectothiorhodospira magna TaxID=867345 RepID=A0A1H8YWT0_9GAMM|nr:Rrf2 family transcriptional regulator [Ectothiorhodospira magna]SEP56685.1 transcriptional regulator, BadM/Rrf2 family [Ectothiorhodospira magna]